MKKKVQLIALSVLLVAVIAGGVWFLKWNSKEPAANLPVDPDASQSDMPNTPQPGAPMNDPIAVTEPVTRLTGYRLQTTERDVLTQYNDCLWDNFVYQDQVCVFALERESGDGPYTQASVVSMTTGEVLKTYAQSEFLWPDFDCLVMDDQGTAWTVRYSDAETGNQPIQLAPCKKDVNESDIKTVLSAATFEDGYRRWTSVQKGYLFQFSMDMTQRKQGGVLEIFVWDTGERILSITNVYSYCLDQQGVLYYLNVGQDSPPIVAYSLENQQELWRYQEDGYVSMLYGPYGILAGTEGGCYVLGHSYTGIGKLAWLDSETRQLALVADFSKDLEPASREVLYGAHRKHSFSADSDGRLYFSWTEEIWSDEESQEGGIESEILQKTCVLEPEYKTVAPEDMVVLTITSPYVVGSVDEAVSAFQRKHPEYEIRWDTQYVSREELQKDALAYKDQITLRVITGDIGDIIMVNGSGLDEDVITHTDAFADLSGYLDACPFKDQLNDAPLEALRSADGAVRAVPIAMVPQFYIWNMTLLEELGNPFDPNTVTWSELLKLVKQWKDEGIDLSLACGYERSGTENAMLNDLLLANLYDAEKEDGTVQLDQPYLRELLELWKEVKGSPQLFREMGENDKALFTIVISTGYFADFFYDCERLYQSYGITPQVAPIPKGEVDKRQQGYTFCWAVSNASAQKDAAWEVLQYLISAGTLPDNIYLEDTLPWNTQAQRDWFEHWYHDDPQYDLNQEFLRQFQYVMAQPYSRLSEKYGWYQAVSEPIQQYLSDKITLDDAMTQANTNWARMLLE